MQAVDKDLMAMKVAELKEELQARGESKTTRRGWLRRRLHGAIVREHLDAADMEEGQWCFYPLMDGSVTFTILNEI